jgi:hypothetical protein
MTELNNHKPIRIKNCKVGGGKGRVTAAAAGKVDIVSRGYWHSRQQQRYARRWQQQQFAAASGNSRGDGDSSSCRCESSSSSNSRGASRRVGVLSDKAAVTLSATVWVLAASISC